jgi:tyrosine-protein phosphatase YwqE
MNPAQMKLNLQKKDDNYCMNEVIQSKPMHIFALLDATYYFDYEISDEIIKEFPKKSYEQSFIKRTIKTNLIRAIFDDYHDLLERFSIINDEINLRKKSTQIRKELVAHNSQIRRW